MTMIINYDSHIPCEPKTLQSDDDGFFQYPQ